MNFKEIGAILKKRRKSLGIRQKDLAQLAGIGVNTLYKIERGNANPALSTLFALTETLGLSVSVAAKNAVFPSETEIPNP